MVPVAKLLSITIWVVLLGFIGMSCDCLHQKASHDNASHAAMEMNAAHMSAMSGMTTQVPSADECAHGCGDKMTAELPSTILALQGETKFSPVKFTVMMPDWQGSSVAFSANILLAHRNYSAPPAPPDKTPVTLKIRLLT